MSCKCEGVFYVAHVLCVGVVKVCSGCYGSCAEFINAPTNSLSANNTVYQTFKNVITKLNFY